MFSQGEEQCLLLCCSPRRHSISSQACRLGFSASPQGPGCVGGLCVAGRGLKEGLRGTCGCRGRGTGLLPLVVGVHPGPSRQSGQCWLKFSSNKTCAHLFPTIPRNVHFRCWKILVIRSSEGRENHQSWDVICVGAGAGISAQNVWSQPACVTSHWRHYKVV